jgi:hypothetical protein
MAKETAKASPSDLLSSVGILELISQLVGDFGLATSSLAAVDPSDLSPSVVHSDSELTLGLSQPVKPQSTLTFSRGWN